MKVKKLCILFLFTSLVTSGCAHKFGYPVDGENWYSIQTKFSAEGQTEEGTCEITEVSVNGIKARDFLVYQETKEVFDKKIHTDSPFEVKIRYGWEGDKDYEIKVALKNPETGKSFWLNEKLKSPSSKGYWNSQWKNYLTLLIAEENGYRRTNYPVHATVGILSKYFHSPEEIRVVKVEKKGRSISSMEIPCQVYDVTPWADAKLLSFEESDESTGMPITRYHPTTTLSLAFQVNLEPYEKTSYLVFYNNPDAGKSSFESDLQVLGKGLAKTIENSFYKVVLDERSGMVTEIHEKETGIKLEHKLETNGAIHWNPGAYSPPHMWSHSSDWENPSFSEVIGPIFYALSRTAPLPHLQDVTVSITYRFYKDSPFILMDSVMEIKKDLFVKALRNGEVVFNKDVFNKAAYKSLTGKVNIIDFAHSRMHPDHVEILRPDTPWIAFFNREKNIAFSSLFLNLSTTNLDGDNASLQQPYIYIQHGPWYYLARAFVYSFGSNNQSRMLPVKKGSVYSEKTGWITFPFNREGYFSFIDNTYNMLKYPLSVVEDIETYPESPEGWLVPILTEAFEEGVKDAIGGKKKK